jgi:hypothetical protein
MEHFPSSHTDISIADFENQGAHNIAKQHDPEGKRTIGAFASVLFGKPD